MITTNESKTLLSISKDILEWFSRRVGIDNLSITEIQVDFSSKITDDGDLYDQYGYMTITIENSFVISITIPSHVDDNYKVIFNEISQDMISDAPGALIYPTQNCKVIYINSNSTNLVIFSKSTKQAVKFNYLADNYFVLHNIDLNTSIDDLQIYSIEINTDNKENKNEN
jgi:hypothetical protein